MKKYFKISFLSLCFFLYLLYFFVNIPCLCFLSHLWWIFCQSIRALKRNTTVWIMYEGRLDQHLQLRESVALVLVINSIFSIVDLRRWMDVWIPILARLLLLILRFTHGEFPRLERFPRVESALEEFPMSIGKVERGSFFCWWPWVADVSSFATLSNSFSWSNSSESSFLNLSFRENHYFSLFFSIFIWLRTPCLNGSSLILYTSL
jgi:hypothetical protein